MSLLKYTRAWGNHFLNFTLTAFFKLNKIGRASWRCVCMCICPVFPFPSHGHAVNSLHPCRYPRIWILKVMLGYVLLPASGAERFQGSSVLWVQKRLNIWTGVVVAFVWGRCDAGGWSLVLRKYRLSVIYMDGGGVQWPVNLPAVELEARIVTGLQTPASPVLTGESVQWWVIKEYCGCGAYD